MKKALITILSIALTSTAMADIKYNNYSHTFYSLPQNAEINQQQYHDLFLQVAILSSKKAKLMKLSENQHISSYLLTLGTPTALRLLSDISAGGMSASLLWIARMYHRTHVHQWAYSYYITFRWPSELARFNKNVYTSTCLQVGETVITCWNSGVYVKPVCRMS